jgi:hypothetical protein
MKAKCQKCVANVLLTCREHQSKGNEGKVSEVILRIRLTERTFNINLPPFSFPNAEFVKQQEIEDDGEPPRQVVCAFVCAFVCVCVCVCLCACVRACVRACVYIHKYIH